MSLYGARLWQLPSQQPSTMADNLIMCLTSVPQGSLAGPSLAALNVPNAIASLALVPDRASDASTMAAVGDKSADCPEIV